ncbi:MAG TPA: transposase [Bacteroidales bacterium]
MPTGYQIKDQHALHYVTLQVVYWVDVFTRKVYRDIVIESLRYCQQEKGLEIYAYVIMSNHIHLVVRSEREDLSDIVRDFKKYTSKKLTDAMEEGIESRKSWMLRLFIHAAKRQNKKGTYQVWTHENHAIQLYSNEVIQEKVNYIHQNPVRSGIVSKPEEYLYSSARNYAGMENLLDIIQITKLWKTY